MEHIFRYKKEETKKNEIIKEKITENNGMKCELYED